MKIISLFVLALNLGATEYAVVLNSSASASGTLPTTGAYASPLTAYRVEFRLHHYAVPAANAGYIWALGNEYTTGLYAYFNTDSNPTLSVSANPSGPLDNINLNLRGATDVVCRYQKTVANLLELECWNSNGSGYLYSTTPGSSYSFNLSGQPVSLGSSSTSTDLSFLRFFSSTVPLNSPPPSLTNGNLGDWEFENSLTDSSSFHTTITGSGITYAADPVVPINVIFGQWGSQLTWSANNGTLSLNGLSSYSPTMNFYNIATYAWAQTGTPPSTGVFSSPSTGTTTFTAGTPGDYQIQLTVGDGGVDTPQSTTVDFGAVNTVSPANPTVITGNASMDATLGPLTMFGTAPWLWYDFAEMANADVLASLYANPPAYGTSALPGTISVNNGGHGAGQVVTGTGTNFIRDLIDCAPSSASSTAYTCTSSGLTYANFGNRDRYFMPDVSSTGSPTINLNGLGAISVSCGGTCTAGKIYTITLNYPTDTQYLATILSGPLMYVWFNSVDGTGAGRIMVNVDPNVTPTATSLSLIAYNGYPGPTQSGLHYSHPDTIEQYALWNYNSQPSNNLDYYDAVHALYKIYFRTGLTRYLTEARTLADNWYIYATSQGYWSNPPRAMGYMGVMDRAADGKPNYMNSLWVWFNNAFNNNGNVNNFCFFQPLSSTTQGCSNPSSPYAVGFSWDTREVGYQVRYASRGAALDTTNRSSYCAMLHNVINNLISSTQDSIGQWQSDLYTQNPSIPLAPISPGGAFGASPWRDAQSALGLQEAYSNLNSPSVCNDPATALTAKTVVHKFSLLLHDQGEGYNSNIPGWGQWGNINYGSNQSNYSWFPSTSGVTCPGSVGSGGVGCVGYTTGTLQVTTGSNAVVGSGTNFNTVFCTLTGSPCHSTVRGVDSVFIAIPELTGLSSPPLGACNLVAKVASVADDTHLTLANNWTCGTGTTSGIGAVRFGWMAVPQALNNCAVYSVSGTPSNAATCESTTRVDLQPDPSLAHEMHYVWAWDYAHGNTTALAWSQQSAGTDYGGSAGGPGSSISAGGPYAVGIGNTGNFDYALYPCTANPAPCDNNGVGPANALGKSFGFSAGAGNANNAWAEYQALPVLPINTSTAGTIIVKGKTSLK